MSYGRVRTSTSGVNVNGQYLTDDELRRFLQRSGEIFRWMEIDSFEARESINFPYGLLKLAEDTSDYGCCIAGGSVASSILGLGEFHKANDIDIFCYSWIEFQRVVNILKGSGYHLTNEDENLIVSSPQSLKFVNLRPPHNSAAYGDKQIQVIKMAWYANPASVLDSFDLTCVQFALAGGRVYYSDNSLSDLKNRIISVHRTLYPVSLMRRIAKYLGRGFKMRDGNSSDYLDAHNLCTSAGSQASLVVPNDTYPSTQTESISDTGLADWNNPQYRKDYYELDLYSFKKKWESK